MSKDGKIPFGTRYGARCRVYSCPGSDLEPKYSAVYLQDGSLDLEVVGTVNVFEEIQSHREECDLQCILRRFLNGETDVLNRVQGFFADTVGMPTTYPEMFNIISKSESFFNSLPVETKTMFHNNFQEFLTASQSPDFLSLFVSKATSEASPSPDTSVSSTSS